MVERKTGAEEKRGEPRFRIICEVTYQKDGSEEKYQAGAYDISRSGIRIISGDELRAGEEVWVLAHLKDDMKVSARATAVWACQVGDDDAEVKGGGYFVGLRFLEILEDDLNRLNDFVAEQASPVDMEQ